MVPVRGGEVHVRRAALQEDVAPGYFLEHEREVLGTHERVLDLDHAVLPEHPGEGLGGEGGLGVVVDGHGVQDVPVHLGAHTVGGGDPVRELAHGHREQFRVLAGQRAHACTQLRRIRDHVHGLPGGELGDRGDHGIEHAEPARDHDLQRGAELEQRGHRVLGRVGLRTVPALAVERDVHVVRAGHRGARAVVEHALLTGAHVDAVRGHGLLPGDLEQALLEHGGRSTGALLTGLEHEDDVAREILPSSAQQFGRAHETRGVQVVTARVHVPVARGVLQPGLLHDRQPVHVPAQQHGGSGLRTAQHRDHRGHGLALGDLQVAPGQGVQDLLLGPRQVVAEFGVGVQGAAQRHEFGLQ